MKDDFGFRLISVYHLNCSLFQHALEFSKRSYSPLSKMFGFFLKIKIEVHGNGDLYLRVKALAYIHIYIYTSKFKKKNECLMSIPLIKTFLRSNFKIQQQFRMSAIEKR